MQPGTSQMRKIGAHRTFGFCLSQSEQASAPTIGSGRIIRYLFLVLLNEHLSREADEVPRLRDGWHNEGVAPDLDSDTHHPMRCEHPEGFNSRRRHIRVPSSSGRPCGACATRRAW